MTDRGSTLANPSELLQYENVGHKGSGHRQGGYVEEVINFKLGRGNSISIFAVGKIGVVPAYRQVQHVRAVRGGLVDLSLATNRVILPSKEKRQLICCVGAGRL